MVNTCGEHRFFQAMRPSGATRRTSCGRLAISWHTTGDVVLLFHRWLVGCPGLKAACDCDSPKIPHQHPPEYIYMASSIRRVAVIAGAAQGIGRAIAERLAKDGLDLGLFDLPHSKELMEELAKSLRSEFGTKVVTVYGNVAVESDVQALVDTVVQELGELYAVRVTFLSLADTGAPSQSR